jgi:hypothetical protein
LGKIKSAGKHPETGELLHWEFFDIFDKNNYDIKKYHNDSWSSVRCITTNEEFQSMSEATKCHDVSRSMIGKCCEGEVKYSKDRTTGEILLWEYINKSTQNRFKLNDNRNKN